MVHDVAVQTGVGVGWEADAAGTATRQVTAEARSRRRINMGGLCLNCLSDFHACAATVGCTTTALTNRTYGLSVFPGSASAAAGHRG